MPNKTENKEDYVLYVVARSYASDLPSCNAGKMAAQATHAAHAIGALSLECDEITKKAFDSYLKQADNFGTTIILSGSLLEIVSVLSEFTDHNVNRNTGLIVNIKLITDPSYPFFVDTELLPYLNTSVTVHRDVTRGNTTLCTREEVTCLGIFGKPSILKSISPTLASLGLHP